MGQPECARLETDRKPVVTKPSYRVAPPGFTPEQWEEFLERGMLVVRNALSQEEVDRYVEAIDRVCASAPNYRPRKDYRVANAVTADPVLSELIDHPRHVGYGYDLYGELLKVQRSDVFVRPRNTNRSTWHPDSPRPTPYATFSPVLPLRLCIGYWLTDLPRTGMANFIYLRAATRVRSSSTTTRTGASPARRLSACLPGPSPSCIAGPGTGWTSTRPTRCGRTSSSATVRRGSGKETGGSAIRSGSPP